MSIVASLRDMEDKEDEMRCSSTYIHTYILYSMCSYESNISVMYGNMPDMYECGF